MSCFGSLLARTGCSKGMAAVADAAAIMPADARAPRCTRADALRARRRDSWRRGWALAALTLLVIISPSAIGQSDLRAERYCFHVGDGVCDEGPHAEAPCAVGADEYDCRRRVGFVEATPKGPAWQPGRIVDADDDRWPSSWRSEDDGAQSVTIELGRPRCLATMRVAWWGDYSARDYLIKGSLDGATWVTLVTADDVAVGYGDRVDNWELETEILSDGSEVGLAGRARFLLLEMATAHAAHYELRSLSWTQNEELCPECGADLTDCGTCTAQGCAWCDETSGGACQPDAAAACSASSRHTSAWRTPETLQRRTCAGGCEGEMCGAGEQVAAYLSPPAFAVPAAADPANPKRDAVPMECAEFDVALDPSKAVASSTLNSNYPPSEAFDGLTSGTGYANVWMSDQGCRTMAGAVCGVMEPQWISYDFGQPQAICSYSLRSRAVALWMSPQSWDFQGSHDNSHWVTITQVRAEPEWAATERREYDAGLAVFRWFRIYVTEVFGAGVRSELQLALQEVDLMPPLNECVSEPLEFETAAPTPSTDRECSLVRECTVTQYETVAPTANSNRECAELRRCYGHEYESLAATATTDRQCTSLTVCIDGEYVESSGLPVWNDPSCSALSPTCYYVTDRICTGLPTVGSFDLTWVYSDALTLAWPEPVREGYDYEGFIVLLDGVDAATIRSANDFTQTKQLSQTIIGLQPATTYQIIIRVVWETFGASLLSDELSYSTGPAVSPTGRGTTLYSDALQSEWAEPPSPYPISGWVLYSRQAPYVVLDGFDCGGTAVSPPVTTDRAWETVPACMAACDASATCCGFRYDAGVAPLECTLVVDCSGDCGEGCIGNFYEKQNSVVSTTPSDLVGWHAANDYSGAIQSTALVQGLQAGRSYDFWAVARIFFQGAVIESLPVGNCESVMPSFQQMTVPAGTSPVLQVTTTARWSDAMEVTWQSPVVPADVQVVGYQVYYIAPGETLGTRPCVDDPANNVIHKTAGMQCSVLAPAHTCRGMRASELVLARECCVSCAGFPYFPDTPETSTLDLFPQCGHCGVFLAANPRSMVVRGLTPGSLYSFYMVPIITDQHLVDQAGFRLGGIALTATSFVDWTTPDVVTDAQATPLGFETVGLDWSTPTVRGGVSVLGYRILYRRSLCGTFKDTATLSGVGGVNVFLTDGPITSAVIQDLPARNVDYDFVIVPIISDGNGLQSECFTYLGGDGIIQPYVDNDRYGQHTIVSNFVTGHTGDVPDPPTRVVASSAPNGLEIVFVAPWEDGGSVVTSYRVVCTPVDGGSAVQVDTSTSPVSVGGLRDGVNYEVTVAATNEFGYGEDSITPSVGMPFSDCDAFVPPAHSNATCQGGSAYGAVCEAECVAGYDQVGLTFYECQATGDWLGDMRCLDANECLSVPCAHDGACRESSDGTHPLMPIDTFACTCEYGYVGELCTGYLDPCLSTPCQNGGTCVHGAEWSYTCSCEPNFTGENCESCDLGWESADCSVDVDECASQPCFNRGTCYDDFNSWVCHCAAGYYGERCAGNVDECVSVPCQGNGECHEGSDSYVCDCLPGWTGENCAEQVQVCDELHDLCDTNAACWYEGGWDPAAPLAFWYEGIWNGPIRCECSFGYAGDGSNSCQDVDECASMPCLGGTCAQTALGYYECTCADGYEGVNCDVEIFDCGSSPCEHGGHCVEAVPGYSCDCQTGFTGDNCETDIDDCASHPCQNGGTCFDWTDSFNCHCDYRFTGEVCDTEQNLCLAEIDDCDRVLSTCTHTGPGTYSCTCVVDGYASVDGFTCADVDECAAQPCDAVGTEACLESRTDVAVSPGQFVCRCLDGYAGSLCDQVQDECIAQPCLNSGACSAFDGYYTCACASGYEGYNCESETDECRVAPCANGGDCVDGVLSYICNCQPGWTGDDCEQDINECGSGPCLNGATCNHQIDAFTCACAAGYSGELCGDDVDECASAPCTNGGVCTDTLDSYSCACAAGFDDEVCGTAINPCTRQEDDCDRVRSVCVPLGPGAYECACASGWDGADCANDVQPPVVLCPASFTITNVDGKLAGSVTGSQLQATEATDNSLVAPDVTVSVCTDTCEVVDTGLAQISLILGTSTVRITATDVAANQATCEFTIVVVYPKIVYDVLTPVMDDFVDLGRYSSDRGGTVVATGQTKVIAQPRTTLQIAVPVSDTVLESGGSAQTVLMDELSRDIAIALDILASAVEITNVRRAEGNLPSSDLAPIDFDCRLVGQPGASDGLKASLTSQLQDAASVLMQKPRSRHLVAGQVPTFAPTCPVGMYLTADEQLCERWTTSHDERFFDIVNEGTSPLGVDMIVSNSPWAYLFQGSVFTQLNLPASIPVGESLRVGVLFHGEKAPGSGVHSGSITVTSNDPSLLSLDVPLSFSVGQSTPYSVFQPQILAQQVMDPLDQTRVAVQLHNSRESSIWWEFVGCEGNDYLFDIPRVLSNRWFDNEQENSVRWLGALPGCSGTIAPGAHQELDIVFNALYRSGVYGALVEVSSGCYNPCPLVNLDGTAEACTAAGDCLYTAGVEEVQIDCVATHAIPCQNAALDGTSHSCTRAGECTYTEEVVEVFEACTANDKAVCNAIDLRSQSERCTDAGNCTYIPAVADACDTVSLDGNPATCTSAGACVHTAAVAAVTETCYAMDKDICAAISMAGTIANNQAACEGVTTLSGNRCYYSSALNTCTAVDESACAGVFLNGLEATCLNAGTHETTGTRACAYIAGVAQVDEACTGPGVLEECAVSEAATCAAVTLDGTAETCTSAGFCTFTESVAEECQGSDQSVCGAIYLFGDPTTCTSVVPPSGHACIYTAPDPGAGVPEACDAYARDTCGAISLASPQERCNAAANCTYTAADPDAGVAEECAASQIASCGLADLRNPELKCTSAGACDYTPSCTGTATLVPATCGDGNDENGDPCAVAASGTTCAINSGSCSFVASHTPTCEWDPDALSVTNECGTLKVDVLVADNVAACPAGCTVAPATCVASDAEVCGCAVLDGTMWSCTGLTTPSGAMCRYTPASDPDGSPGTGDEIPESCAAADEAACAAATQTSPAGTCAAMGDCELLAATSDPCTATDASTCGNVTLNGNSWACRLEATPSGTPCDYTAASDPDGVPGTGDEVEEACRAAAEATCLAVTSTAIVEGGAAACTGAGACEYDASVDQRCAATDESTCSSADLRPTEDVCVEDGTSADGECSYVHAVAEACTATDAEICPSIDLGDATDRCEAAGDCGHRLGVVEVVELCEASAAAACAAADLRSSEAKCVAAGQCTYAAGPETCTATDSAACSGVTLDGTAATCTGAGNCVYTASSAYTAEACTAADENVCATASIADPIFTCAAAGACTFVAATSDPCVAEDSQVCASAIADDPGSESACTTATTPSGTACAYTAASDPDGVAGTGDEVAEACKAAAEATCLAVTSAAIASGGSAACTNAGACTYDASVDQKCAATAEAACGSADLHTAEATCVAAGDCTYSAGDVCSASDADECSAVLLDGTADSETRCTAAAQDGTGAGGCTYTAASDPDGTPSSGDEVPESCSATEAAACAAAPMVAPSDLCAAAGACAYTAPVTPVTELCFAWQTSTCEAVELDGTAATCEDVCSWWPTWVPDMVPVCFAVCTWTAPVQPVAEACVATDLASCAAADMRMPEEKCKDAGSIDLVIEACVATNSNSAPDAALCGAVDMRAPVTKCETAGHCAYTPASSGVVESCQALDAAVCGAKVLDGTEAACACGVTPSGNPCVYTAAGPGVVEACNAVDQGICSAVDLAQATAATCTGAGACTHRAPVSSSCSFTPADPATGVAESCAAADVSACASVVLDGTSATCTNAGVCTYTAQADSVSEACIATDADDCDVVLDGNANTCTDASTASGTACVHTPAGPGVVESCKAADDAACSGVTLDGTASTCTAAGECTYTPSADAIAEACAATDLAACAAASLLPEQTAAAAGDCIFTAPVTPVVEACEPASDTVACLVPDETCAGSDMVLDTKQSVSLLEVSLHVQPGQIDAQASTVQMVTSSIVAGQELTVKIVPVDVHGNGGTPNLITRAGLEFILELREEGSSEKVLVSSYFDSVNHEYFATVPLAKSGNFSMRVDSKWTGGTYAIPQVLGNAAEEMLDDCGGGTNHVYLHSVELDVPNYVVPEPTISVPGISNVVVADACARVTLDGRETTCTDAGECAYTPFGSGNAEACTHAGPPLTYETATMAAGSFYEGAGEQWSFTDLPNVLPGIQFVKTRFADADSSADILDWLCFDIDRDSTVYVLYDNRASVPPPWLTSGFQLVDGIIARSLVGTSIFADTWDIYAAERNAGRVCMGGNSAYGVQKMYIPAAAPRKSHRCTVPGAMRQVLGLRTPDMTVTPGGLVHDVYITFVMRDSLVQSVDNVNLTISIEAADHAALPRGTPAELSTKTVSTKTVAWKLRSKAADPCSPVGMQLSRDSDSCGCVPMFDPPSCSDVEPWLTFTTPDLSELLKEVVDRPGWQAGNAVMFLVEATGDSDAANLAKAIVGETPTLIYSWGELVGSEQIIVHDAACVANSRLNELGSGCTCIEGFHPSDDLQTCQPCPPAHYGVNETCYRCDDGTQPAADAASCEPCPFGTAGQRGICTRCDSGKTPTVGRTACTTCPVGFAGAGGNCQPCSAGTEPSHDQTDCLGCVSTHVSSGTLCTLCPPGTEPDALQSTCIPCAATFAGTGGSCSVCGDGEAPNSERVACEPCPPGTAGLNGVCTPCPEGQTPTPSLTGCEGCLSGTVSSGGLCVTCRSGSSGIDGNCTVCADGTEPDELRVTCIPCSLGYAGRDGACFPCGAGQRPRDDRTACSSCPIGTYGPTGETCEICAAGKQPNLGKTACETCGTGMYSADGRECKVCDPGFEPTVEQDACSQCVDQYSPDGRRCLSCSPAERPDATFRATSCLQCADLGPSLYGPDGVHCFECPAGYEPNHWNGVGNDGCSPCAGRGLTFFSWDGSECTECPPGSQPSFDRTTCEFCVTKQSNMHSIGGDLCSVCLPGEEPFADRTGCRSCAAVSSSHVSAGGAPCVSCLPGFQPNTELTGCEQCAPHMISPGGSPCQLCDPDPLIWRYLQPADDQVSCFPCPEHTYFIAASHSCHVCGPGYRLNDDRTLAEPCILCGTGEVGVDGICSVCAPGLYANSDHTECLDCGDWEDLALHHPNGLVGDADGYIGVAGVCQRCPAGKAPGAQTPDERDDAHTDCTLCPLGRFSGNGTECELCQPAHEPNQMSCMPESHHQDPMPPWDVAVDGAVMSLDVGATGCVRCLPGWYSAGAGQLCSSCAVGQQPNAEQTACESCGAGTGKVSGDGRVLGGRDSGLGVGRKCHACPPGTEPSVALDKCEKCVDKYSPDGVACLSCGLGLVPETPWAATKCLHCFDESDRSHGPDGVGCAICPPGSQPDHWHETPCTLVPGMKACVGDSSQRHCVPMGSQCPDSAPNDNSGCALCASLGDNLYSTDGTPCVECAPGKEPNADQTECLSCLFLGASLVSPDGSPCQPCSAGKQPEPNHTECLACDAGQYSSAGVSCHPCMPGQQPSDDATDCVECSSLTGVTYSNAESEWSSVAGVANISTLYDQAVAATTLVADTIDTLPSNIVDLDSKFRAISDSLIDVHMGQNLTIGISADGLYSLDGRACLTCPHGMTADPLHAGCVRCPKGRAGTFGLCTDCPAGRIPNPLGTVCDACDIGKYNDEPAQAACKPCFDEGMHIPSYPGVSCVPCHNGTIPAEPLRHTTASMEWLAETQAVLCRPNTDGDLAECYAQSTVSAGCTLCEPGWAGVLGFCDPCPGGHFSSADHSSCDKCPVGSVSTNGIQCTECAAGRSPNADQTKCNLCEDGLYSADGVRCLECWENAESLPERTWCTCSAGSEPNWDNPRNVGNMFSRFSCLDLDECQDNHGGCDESTVCRNVSPGRECGPCPIGYSGPHFSKHYSVLSGNTTCIEPPVDDDETVMSPELSLVMVADPAVVSADAMVGSTLYYDDGESRELVTLIHVDRSKPGEISVTFEDGATATIDFVGSGVSLEFEDGTSQQTESQQLVSRERQKLEQGFIADIVRSVGVNASQVQITGVVESQGARRRRMQQGGIDVEVTFIIITDLPEVFDELNAQLADPNSLLLTGNTTGFVASGNTTQVVFNALQGLHSLAYACPGRLVRDPTTNTCEPCPATTEYRRDVDGTQSCEVCPVGRWSEEAGQCTKCPAHQYTPHHIRCFRCEEGYTVNANSSGCDACRSDLGFYNSDGRDCLPCPPGTRPDRAVAARHCVSCQVDGPRHYSSLGRYRNRTTSCTAAASASCAAANIGGDDETWARDVAERAGSDVPVACVAVDEEICSATNLSVALPEQACTSGGLCVYTAPTNETDESCRAAAQTACSSAAITSIDIAADTAACASAGACRLWVASRWACEFIASAAGACVYTSEPRTCVPADETVCADANMRLDPTAYNVESATMARVEASAQDACLSAGDCLYTADLPAVPQPVECEEMCGGGTQVNTTTYTFCDSCVAVGPRHVSFDGTPCEACTPGRQANPERTECLDCAAGQYSEDGLQCTPCPVGWEPNTRLAATACIHCLVNHYSAGDHCHRCVEDGVTQAMDGMVLASPETIDDCRCPDGTYDSVLPGGATSHIYCWDDGEHTSMPWLEQSNIPSRQDVESGKKCVACPSCLECDGGVPRVRAGYHVGGEDAGNFSDTLLLLSDVELAGDRHVYRCPLPELCLGEVQTGCDIIDCTPLIYEIEHPWVPDHIHPQSEPRNASSLDALAAGLGGSRCAPGFSGRFCLGQCLDGDGGTRFCDSVKCEKNPDWAGLYRNLAVVLLVLGLLSSSCASRPTGHDVRMTRCCTRGDKAPAAEQPIEPPDGEPREGPAPRNDGPRLVHGCCSFLALRGVAGMLLKPVFLVWPRLRIAVMLLATMYQVLSSLSAVLALPLPQPAWSLIEFFAPFANLDVTLFPSVGCGLGYYSVLRTRLLTLPVVIGPAWLLWLVRSRCVCLETRAAKQDGTTTLLRVRAAQLMRSRNLLEGAIGWTFFVVYLAHPSVTRSLLQLYDCRSLDDGSSHLVADVRVVCTLPRVGNETGTGALDAEYSLHVLVATAGLIVWCGVMPLLVGLRLWFVRKPIAEGVKQPGLSPLHAHCKPSCYLWEVFSMLARSALAAGLLLWERGSVAQPAAGALLSALFLGVAIWAQPLATGSGEALERATAAVSAAKERVKEAKEVASKKKTALKSHLDEHDTKGTLGRKQLRIAARILRPHIVAGAGLRQFAPDRWNPRIRHKLEHSEKQRHGNSSTRYPRPWVPEREWRRSQALEEDDEVKDADVKEKAKQYLVLEINKAFEEAEREPDYTVDHLTDFAKRSALQLGLDEAVAVQREATHRLLQAQRGLRPRGAGRLANLALALCLGATCAAYSLCFVLRSGAVIGTPDAERLAEGAGQLLLLVQIPPLVALGLMILRPLPGDCRRANAVRLATKLVPHAEPEPEPEAESHESEEEEETAGGAAEDGEENDEAADIQRIAAARRGMEGGTLPPLTTGAVGQQRGGKRLGI